MYNVVSHLYNYPCTISNNFSFPNQSSVQLCCCKNSENFVGRNLSWMENWPERKSYIGPRKNIYTEITEKTELKGNEKKLFFFRSNLPWTEF